MVIQVFVDDSGGKGHTRHFALVGLIGFSEDWQRFSKEWRECLQQSPPLDVFKMNEASGRGGRFRRFTVSQRDEKLRQLARIAGRHAKITTYSVIDLEAHAQTWANSSPPQRDPYFWPFQNTIMAACHTLWDAGWREKFEITFDEQVIFGPRAQRWYPVIKCICEIQFPDQSSILPDEPLFRSDDVCLPIQAADMFAWCRRRATDEGGAIEFEWLIDELSQVQETEYSQYYDLERMKSVQLQSKEIAAKKTVPLEVLELYAQVLQSMRPNGKGR